MTTLIAYQHEDFCLIAADSQTTGYDMANDCSPMGKIAINGKYLQSIGIFHSEDIFSYFRGFII